MSKIKLEHIDNLRRGKKSWAKIGSRWVAHHLYKHEQIQYERALKNKYLEINDKDRVNLRNLWEKVCHAKWWKHLVLLKSSTEDKAVVLLNEEEQKKGDKKSMKAFIKTSI